VVWDEKRQRQIVLLTNHLDFGATTIASIYKDRWEIELFFKALKQNLKIKSFVGTSENALKIQIWTALIAILILRLRLICACPPSPSPLVGEGWDEGILKILFHPHPALPLRERVGKATALAVSNDIAVEIKKLSRRLRAMLVLKWLHHRSRSAWSFSNLTAMLRLNLFTYRDLKAWIQNPFDTPPIVPSTQLALSFSGIGQPIAATKGGTSI
jgi:hypothetical protein